jgi:hypothetical protein
VNQQQADKLFAAITGCIERSVTQAVDPIVKELSALRVQVQEANERSASFKYCGTFEEGRAYRPGNFVSSGGSMWACVKDTSSRPPGDCWRLCVKAGRDGDRRR